MNRIIPIAIGFAAAFAVAFSGSASAQTTPTPVPRPACYPMVNGYPVGLPHVVNGNLGIHTYWACSDAKAAAPEVYGFYCPHLTCSSVLLGQVVSAVTRATARVGTANTAWDTHIKVHCTPDKAKELSDEGRLCAEWLSILAGPLTAAWRSSLPKGAP